MRQNNRIKTALVSTNSICQGEQVPILWPYLFQQGVSIDFAHQTFKWSNEAKGKAAVYCVIVGFSLGGYGQKYIYEYEDIKGEPAEIRASTINAYLVDAPSIFIERRGKPLSNIPPMQFGNMPLDGGHLVLDINEKKELTIKEPDVKKICQEADWRKGDAPRRGALLSVVVGCRTSRITKNAGSFEQSRES